MRKEFYRFYFLLILAAAVVIYSFNQLFELLVEPPHYQLNVDNLFEQPVENTGLTLVEWSSIAFTDELNERLEQQEVVAIQAGDRIIYYKAANEQQLLQLGPLELPQTEGVSETAIILLFYSGLAILVLLMMRPLFRDLQQLQRQARDFGSDPRAFDKRLERKSAIYPLSKTFHQMSNQLAELIQLHKDLSHTIAHDIRTPLSRMKFVLEKITPQIDGTSADNLHADMEAVEALLDDYLVYAKQDVLEHYRSPTSQVVNLITQPLAQQFQNYSNDVTLAFKGTDSKASFDIKSMQHALQNLISNAFRYAKSEIIVCFDQDASQYYFYIEDDGPGFHLQRNQGKALKRIDENSSGYGLGFYIVRKIMVWHDGDVTFDNSPTLGGARVTLSWPKD